MKILRNLIILLLLVVLALLGLYQLYKDDAEAALQEAVESRGSRLLGTRVDVDAVQVRRDGGMITLSGLEVANPGGFSNRNMISVDALEVRGDFEGRVIDRVTLRGVDALVELRGARSNFETLGDRVARRAADTAASGAGEADDAAREDESGTGGDEGSEREPAGEGWRVAQIGFEGIRVRVVSDWTSEELDFDAGGFAIEDLDAGTDDLARAATVRFLARVLLSAAERVDDRRLEAALTEKANALRGGLPAPASE